MRQLALDLQLRDEPCLTRYIAGPNQLLHQALLDLSQTLETSAPIYIWGAGGVGKSYLLRALQIAWQEQGGQVYSARDELPIDIPESGQPALVVLDDCHQLSLAQQHLAFAWCIESAHRRWQVVSAGALPLVDLPLRDDLRTRLASGMVYGVLPLRDEQLSQALLGEAHHRGLNLPVEVVNYLLTRFSRDLKNLMWMLNELDKFALEQKRAFTVPLLKQMLAQEGLST